MQQKKLTSTWEYKPNNLSFTANALRFKRNIHVITAATPTWSEPSSKTLPCQHNIYIHKQTSDLLYHMGVSKNRGTPKSSVLIGFSIINHPFWGTPIFGGPPISNGRVLFVYLLSPWERWHLFRSKALFTSSFNMPKDCRRMGKSKCYGRMSRWKLWKTVGKWRAKLVFLMGYIGVTTHWS